MRVLNPLLLILECLNSVLDKPKEEETVHQMLEEMDLGNQGSQPTNIGQDEVHNKHFFH
jgi:hypothetical protein